MLCLSRISSIRHCLTLNHTFGSPRPAQPRLMRVSYDTTGAQPRMILEESVQGDRDMARLLPAECLSQASPSPFFPFSSRDHTHHDHDHSLPYKQLLKAEIRDVQLQSPQSPQSPQSLSPAPSLSYRVCMILPPPPTDKIFPQPF